MEASKASKDEVIVRKAHTDEVVRNASATFNSATDRRHYANEARFSHYNHTRIMAMMRSGQAVDMATLPKHPRTNVLLIGSGPTLDEALPLMKDWKGDIICSTSQAGTLISWGREPEHIVALDNDSNPGELVVDTWEGRKSILHFHPGVAPELVNWWPGPVSLFRKLQPQNPYFATEQALAYSELGEMREGRYWGADVPIGITAQVPMLANVLSAQICIAKILGYKQLTLVGADQSFPGGMTRFSQRSWDGTKWVEGHKETMEEYHNRNDNLIDPIVETEYSIEPELETQYDGLLATTMHIFYAHQIVIAWRLTEKNIINASHKGLLRMFPHVPIEEVIRAGNKGVKGFTLPQIRKVTEEHLARQNIYFFYVGNGIMPHELKDPVHDAPRMLKAIKQQLTAQSQGEHLDIDANMKRIRRLVATVMEG